MNRLKYSSFIAAAVLCLVSCKKDTDVSIKELVAYNASGTATYNVTEGKVALVRNNILSESGNAFPILLSRAFDKDVQATAVIDTSLIKVYDSLYASATPSLSLPAGSFELVNNGLVTIKAGQTYSSDSMRVRLTDASQLKTGTNTYITPVVLQTASAGVPVSTTRQVMFVKTIITSIVIGISSLDDKNIVNTLISNIGGVVNGNNTVYLKGILNKTIDISASVSVKENLSLVNSYNQQNGTNYTAFPAGSYQIVKNTATFSPNSINSADSIIIKYTDLSVFQVGKTYLLPIEAVEGDNQLSPPVDNEKKVVYLVVTASEVNVDPSNSGLSGAIMDRGNWKVTVSGRFSSTYTPEKMLDGKNATAWDSDGKMPAWIQLDMGTQKQVKGFSLVPNYVFRSENILEMTIYSSLDGLVWKKEGVYKGTATSASSTSANPDIKTVRFFQPVPARYFKFEITKSSEGLYTGLSELNGIE